jgi:hypothetical protein
MTLLERVARAMYESNPHLNAGEPIAWEALNRESFLITLYMEQARAAIEAMAEPTAAMEDAAGDTPGIREVNGLVTLHAGRMGGSGLGWRARGEETPLRQAWKAMINAALSENDG